MVAAISITLISLGVFAYVLRIYTRARKSMTWPTAVGCITSSGVVIERDADLNDCHVANIEYRYFVGGREYRSRRVNFGGVPLWNDKHDANATVVAYPVGKTVMVHYDPSNPQESTLEPRANATVLIAIGVALAFIIMGIFYALD